MRSTNEPTGDPSTPAAPRQETTTGPLEVEPRLPTGARVEIRNRFNGGWSSGFQLVAAPSAGYLVRRLSDHSVLPTTFDDADVRLDPVPLPASAPTRWSPPAVA